MSVEVFDEAGRLLDRRSVADFASGAFLTWYVSHRVRFRFTRIDGTDATVSGIFIDPSDANAPAPLPLPAVAQAKFIGTDYATRGEWSENYGADGFLMSGVPARLPHYARVALNGAQTNLIAMTTTDVRALEREPGSTKIAAAWTEELTDRETHRVTLYVVDYGTTVSSQRVEVLDGENVLDSREIAAVGAGQYLKYEARGTLHFRFSRLTGSQAMASAVFFDTEPSPQRLTALDSRR
jgi:hypothetical protein